MLNKSISVYAKKYLNEMNISLLFPIDYKGKDTTLTIAGENEYQVFLNGELVLYGPAKASHSYHRVDEIRLKSTSDENRVVIIIAGYNVNSFDRFNQTPFINYELKDNKDNKIIDYSSTSSICYLYEPRIQKVVRFSYQRQFSECYNNKISNDYFKYNKPINFQKLELIEAGYGSFLTRNVEYPKLNEIVYQKVQEETFKIDKSIKPFDNRYFHIEDLKIFKSEEIEYDANTIASQIVISKDNRNSSILKENQSITYGNKASLTGFIKTSINVNKPSTIYVYFDEINTSEDPSIIDFKFYRNETQNLISYELNEGTYNLLTFQPLTAKYIRIVCLKGEIEVKKLAVKVLENPLTTNLKFSFEDKRIEDIFEAARNTLAANSVDILTDCPSRERAGWLCDSYFSSQAEALFTGKNLVEHNFLENYALYRKIDGVKEGTIPMCYPASFGQPNYIPNWSMWYVLELENYFNRTQDYELVNKIKQNIVNLLEFFKKEENSLGLLEDLKGWVFVEWSFANSEEAIKGVNVPTNALYASFLKAAANLLNKPELKEHASFIRNWIKQNAFNGTYFVDNLVRDANNNLVRTSNTGETTQYYVLHFNVITNEENPSFFNMMLKEFGPNRDINKVHPESYKSNMIVGNFLRLRLLNRYGYYEQTLDETISYFSKMANLTGTLWEHDSIFASLNHGFASYVANIISQAISGLTSIDYKNKIIYFKKTTYSKDYSLSIPLENSYLKLSRKNGVDSIELPSDYKIQNI